MTKEVEKLQELIDNHDNIVFFGGAGVSTESGIPDFRSQNGLYNMEYEYSPETILSKQFFKKFPEEFFKFYRDKMLCDAAKPNAAHLKLAELEEAGKVKAIITQNIDNLHQMAGSKNVLELHGSVYRNHCTKCGKAYGLDYIKDSDGVPHCECGGIVKPDSDTSGAKQMSVFWWTVLFQTQQVRTRKAVTRSGINRKRLCSQRWYFILLILLMQSLGSSQPFCGWYSWHRWMKTAGQGRSHRLNLASL